MRATLILGGASAVLTAGGWASGDADLLAIVADLYPPGLLRGLIAPPAHLGDGWVADAAAYVAEREGGTFEVEEDDDPEGLVY